MANVVEETKKETTGKRPYNNHNRRRYYGPLKVTNLTKEFTTFEEGFIEMSKHVPEIKSFCGETAMYQAVVGNILNVIRDNVPTLNSRQYPNTISFSINSHELGIRTDAGLAFGWRSRFNRDTDEVTYRFRVTYMNLSTPHKISINNLMEDGWEKKKDMVQSHFWDDVEQKRRNKVNGDNKMKIDYNTDIGRKVAEADPPKETVEEKKEINDDIASQLKDFVVDESPAAELTATVTVEEEKKEEVAVEVSGEVVTTDSSADTQTTETKTDE